MAKSLLGSSSINPSRSPPSPQLSEADDDRSPPLDDFRCWLSVHHGFVCQQGALLLLYVTHYSSSIRWRDRVSPVALRSQSYKRRDKISRSHSLSSAVSQSTSGAFDRSLKKFLPNRPEWRTLPWSRCSSVLWWCVPHSRTSTRPVTMALTLIKSWGPTVCSTTTSTASWIRASALPMAVNWSVSSECFIDRLIATGSGLPVAIQSEIRDDQWNSFRVRVSLCLLRNSSRRPSHWVQQVQWPAATWLRAGPQVHHRQQADRVGNSAAPLRSPERVHQPGVSSGSPCLRIINAKNPWNVDIFHYRVTDRHFSKWYDDDLPPSDLLRFL